MKGFFCCVCIALLVLSVAWNGASAASRCSDGDGMCGLRCMQAVCDRFGLKADLYELAELSKKDTRGVTLADLLNTARKNGLKAVGMKIGLDELAVAQVSVIAHLWGDHFVVVESSGSGSLNLTDPPAGPEAVKLEDFQKTYSGFALLVANDENLFPKPTATGPDLRSDGYRFEFGFLSKGAQAARTFKLRNEGTEKITINQVRTSCTCTTATVSESVVPPGCTANLTVVFDSTGRQGEQKQTVYVESNDPITPIMQLSIEGVVRPDRLVLSCNNLEFGSLRKGKGAAKEIYVRDPGDGSLKVSGVSSDCPWVTVRSAQSTDPKRPGYLLKVSLKQNTAIGELKGKLTINTNHPNEPKVEIPVSAVIKGDIEALPDVFFLGLLKKGRSAEKTIKLSTTGEKSLVIEKVESPSDYLIVDIKPEIEGKQYALTAKLQANAPIGSVKGDVVIHTNSSDQPKIRVPVYALVEEK